MTRPALLTILLLALAPASGLRAQVDPAVPTLDESQLELHRYQPRHVYSEDLCQALQDLYGRDLVLADRRVNNFALLDESLLIYETPERMKRILQALAELDAEPEGADVPEPDELEQALSEAEMSLLSFSPRYLNSASLYQLAADLYGRQLLVGENYQDNLRLVERAVLIYEQREAAEELRRRLEELDASQAPAPGGELVVHEYQPRHFSSRGLMQGLQPFRATVNDLQEGTFAQVVNITLLEERGTILVRDHPGRAAQILETLGRLDQPAPQVMVTCQVLRAVPGEPLRPAAADLQQQLRRLLPYDAYTVEATGMLRGSAVSGTRMELEMESAHAAGTQFSLQLQVGSFDPESGALGLTSCQFAEQSQQTGRRNLFQTAATVYRGEMAVLGVAGAEPLFLVIQVHPVGGQAH